MVYSLIQVVDSDVAEQISSNCQSITIRLNHVHSKTNKMKERSSQEWRKKGSVSDRK